MNLISIMLRILDVVFIIFLYSLTTIGCNQIAALQEGKDSVNTALVMKKVMYWVDSGYNDKVIPYIDSFYAANSITAEASLIAKYQLLSEIYYHHKTNNKTASLYLDSLGELVLRKKDNSRYNEQLLAYYFLKGHIALSDKQYDEAFKYYYTGKALIDLTGDVCGNQHYHTTIASILYRQEKYIEAVQYFKRGYDNEILCVSNDPMKITFEEQALSNIGICFEKANVLDSAIYYYDLALERLEKNKERYKNKELSLLKLKGIIWGNKGGTLVKLKRYDEAEQLLKKSIYYNYRPEGEVGDAILAKIKLADLYIILGEYGKCRELIKQLETDVRERPYIIADMRFAKLRSQYLYATKDYKNSLTSLTQYYQLRDSIKDISNYSIENHTNYIREFDNLEKRFELELLQQQNKLKNRYLYLLALLALMAVIIITLLLIRRVVNKKYIEELTVLNEQVHDTNQKLKQSLTLLQESQKENTRMIRIVAHDLRSPIAGIMTLVRMIKQDGQELTKEELTEYIELVEKAGSNALTFIEDMLSVSQSNHNMIKQEVDIASILESCVRIMQPQAGQKNQRIKLFSNTQIINVNEEKIWRLINNLISNAIKFSAPATIIQVKAVVQNNTVLISIQDEGMGIPDAIKENIFTIFGSPGRSGTSGEQSFGLGMVISKQIVDAHNGKIWFESIEGKGTTFFVELPINS